MRVAPADPTAPLELAYFGPDARALGELDFTARHGRAFLLLRGALDPTRRPASPQKTLVLGAASTPPPALDDPALGRDSEGTRGLGQLLVYPVKQTGRTPFPRVVTVGRTKNNDVVLPDVSISKFHAFFKDEDGRFVLADGESRNGTFVEGERVSSAKQGKADTAEERMLGEVRRPRVPLSRRGRPHRGRPAVRLRPAIRLRALSAGLVTVALGCAGASPAHPLPVPPRLPPDEVVVRTASFAFHMGARVDETWTTQADDARTALGSAIAVLLDEEDSAVPTLARQLGVVWPAEPLDFDVSFRGHRDDGPCDSGVPFRLVVTSSRATPTPFFACVLERGFVRLARESTIYRAVLATLEVHGEAAETAAERLYGCMVRYAVSGVVLAGPRDPSGEACDRAGPWRELHGAGARLGGAGVDHAGARGRGSGSVRRARGARAGRAGPPLVAPAGASPRAAASRGRSRPPWR